MQRTRKLPEQCDAASAKRRRLPGGSAPNGPKLTKMTKTSLGSGLFSEDWASYYKVLLYPVLWGLASVFAPSTELTQHILLATAARYAINHGFTVLAHCQGIPERYRIADQNPPVEQLRRELDWDNPLIGTVAAFLLVQVCTPWLDIITEFTWSSLALCALGHYLVVEPVYYLFHVMLHWPRAYKFTHRHHHSSVITQPVSGTSHPFLETIGYLSIFSFPILIPAWCGHFSYEIVYMYFIFFDVMNCIGHCNFEVVPTWLQHGPLKYLTYSSSYHSLHHSRYKANYCLFCPLWDHVFGTVSPDTYQLQHRVRTRVGPKPASLVFIGHGFGWSSILRMPVVSPYLATQGSTTKTWMYPLFPMCILVAVLCRIFKQSCFVVQRYMYKNLTCATWAMPVLACTYASISQHAYLNKILVKAILAADAQGASHVGLGALNKAQCLNNGGKDLVACLPVGCRTKVVHGNTLTAAVVYKRVCQCTDRSQMIFFTGATSTVGTAVVMRLLKDGYRLRVLTQSTERFEKLRTQAGVDRENLARAKSYEEGAACRTWVLGSPLTRPVGHLVAPSTAFLEFAVPGTQDDFVRPFKLESAGSVYIRPDVCDLTFCHFQEPGSVPACLAAAIIHASEGFREHEVDEVDVNQMDRWLDLARKHQFVF